MFAFPPASPRFAIWLMLAGLSAPWMAGTAAAQTVASPSASSPASHVPPKPKPAPKTPTVAPPPGPPAKPGTSARGKPQGHPAKTSAAAAHKKAAPAPAPASVATPPAAPTPAEPEAQKPPEPRKGGTGLPLPRFAALRSDEVNMRAGPGTRYPIDWVYKRRDLPVEIEREFEVWRLVRDPGGTKGWVHQATLTGRRTLIVTGATRSLRKQADAQSPVIAELKPGVIGRIRSCEAGSDWCQVQIGEYPGLSQARGVLGHGAGRSDRQLKRRQAPSLHSSGRRRTRKESLFPCQSNSPAGTGSTVAIPSPWGRRGRTAPPCIVPSGRSAARHLPLKTSPRSPAERLRGCRNHGLTGRSCTVRVRLLARAWRRGSAQTAATVRKGSHVTPEPS